MIELLPWLVLLLLLALKPNIRGRAWTVLLPLVMVEAFAALLVKAASDGALYDYYSATRLVGFGLAVLWALSFRLQGLPRAAAFSRALAIMAVVGVFGAVCYEGLSLRGLSHTLALYMVAAACALLGIAGAAWWCRNWFTPVRFVICLYILLVVMLAVLGSILAGMSFLLLDFFEGFDVFYWLPFHLFVVGPMIGGIVGHVLYGVMLPFMVLTFLSPCYRDRFYKIFRLQRNPAQLPA